jgi:hypothetical protein
MTYFCIKPWCLACIANEPSGFEKHLNIQQQFCGAKNEKKLVSVMTADTDYA